MYNGQERRKYKRIEKPYKSTFRVINFKNLDMSTAGLDIVDLKDISAGGASFNYNENLGIDSFLDLKIYMSASKRPLHCIGKIIRIEQPQPDSKFRTATEFTEISEEEKEMINKETE
jgi:hypothetical protein